MFRHKLLGDIQLYDDSKRRAYVKLADAMRRAQDDPSLVNDARDFVHRHMLTDSHQQQYAKRWLEVLELPVSEIARLLLADTPEANLLRDTAPVFGKGMSAREAFELLYGADAV